MKNPFKVIAWTCFAVILLFATTPGCARADSFTQVITFGTLDFAFTPSDGHTLWRLPDWRKRFVEFQL